MKITSILLCVVVIVFSACGGSGEKAQGENIGVTADGEVVEVVEDTVTPAVVAALPFSGNEAGERVVLDYGHRTVRMAPDETISRPELMKRKQRCFIVMSKKDCYVYVYEPQSKDTVLLARYDAAFALRKGDKERRGDMRTPESTMAEPFEITQIQDASTWEHDFNDGRGPMKSYGDYFLRLRTPGHKGIGIHGSTNNAETVPGRASEGCIRLRDEELIDLARNYAFEGMKVVIKGETVDDYPFEVHAMQRQGIQRLRHINPAKVLSNEQIAKAKAEQGRAAKRVKKDTADQKRSKDEPREGEGRGYVVKNKPNPAREE